MAKKPESPSSTDALANAFGPEFAAAFSQALTGGPGAPGTGTSSTISPQEITIEQMLVDPAMSVTGRQALTGMPFLSGLPTWAIQAAQNGAMSNPDFDPYLGIVSQQGDERVYLGRHGTKVPISFDQWDDEFDVNTKDLKDREENRAANQRIDQQNKVERQLGNDPSQQAGPKKKRRVDTTATATQVKNQPYLWDEQEVTEALKKFRRAGVPVETFDDLVQAWGSMVDRAAYTYSLSEGAKKITPWDVLDMYKSEAKAAGSYVDYQERMNGTQTSVQRSVAEITEGQAFTVLQDNLSRLLGRDPSDDEVKDYLHRMNSLAAANPSITQTVQRFKNGEVVSTNQHTDPGFTAQDMQMAAYKSAQADDGYAETQAATTYFNALQSALGALGEG